MQTARGGGDVEWCAAGGAPAPVLAAPAAPRTWLVIGDKPGDNAQVRRLADGLGWPCETRRLRFQARWQTGKPRFRPTLAHLDPAASDPLAPPWPDLILTIGRRPSMAALWVAGQSGGRTRLVIVGRPRGLLDRFDLVLAPPQYRVPDRPNVLRLALPLLAVDPALVAAEAERWRERLAPLSRPLTAVLVGGPTGPFRFDPAVAADLVRRLAALAADGGTLFVSTSRRTPEPVAAALAAGLPAAVLYRWTADAGDNPYAALLGLADRFVVTGDSASMLVEVAMLGQPLAIFRLPEKHRRWLRLRRWLADRLQPEPPGAAGGLAAAGAWLYDRGIALASREFEHLYRALADRGLAVDLGQPFPAASAAATRDLDAAVARIRRLVSD